MALDRDLAVAVASAAWPSEGRTRTGWETNAATGVRGLRLLVESGRFAEFRLSEAGDRSFPALARNCAAYPGAHAVHEDARRPTWGPDERCDYVDVDPYGSPLSFLGSALRVVRTGGVLALTATDMIVLAGAQPSATRRLYGAEPVRGRLGPEAGLRILLAAADRAAQGLGLHLRPLLGYVGDHHVRAYVSVEAGETALGRVGVLDPSTFDGPPLRAARPVGPLWIGPLADVTFLSRLVTPAHAAEPAAFSRLLLRLREEAPIPAPFFYETNLLAAALHLVRPPSVDRVLDVLHGAGFLAARTHVRPEGVRTNAPRPEVERLVGSIAPSS